MFAGFETATVDVGETTIFIRRRGHGQPVLLLHGFPETHLMWHRVAPVLAEDFTVISADLRGYGASGKPPADADHATYAKSAMAIDMIRMMRAQGFARFSVIGHDRGARVAYRMALDHTACVERLAVLDVIPTSEVFQRADFRLALDFWPWSILSQPAPLPEQMIAGAEEAIVDDALGGWGSELASFPPEVRIAYIEALRDPESAHAICEEYRAAATVDLARDGEDHAAGRLIQCPTLALWSEGGGLDGWYSGAGGPLAIWRNWAADVRGRPIAGGHFFPEQNPGETTTELGAFLQAA
jgi:haloacetate dehalogenase